MPELINRTGESRVMNNGLSATIIRYASAHDIDVRFENGDIVVGRCYRDFRRGAVRCPMIVTPYGNYAVIENHNTNPSFKFMVDIEDVEKVVSVGFWLPIHGGPPYNRNKDIRLHRFLLDAPIDLVVDHINHNSADNRKANLRLCSRTQNSGNALLRKDNTSGSKGVTFHAGARKWMVQINYQNKHHYLGLFSCKEKAADAYDKAALGFFGEFAQLNSMQAVCND